MSSAAPKKSRDTEKQTLSNNSRNRAPIDASTFRADIERHQMKIHQGRPLRGQTPLMVDASEPISPKRSAPSKPRKRRGANSFIKIKSEELSSESERLQGNHSKRILALKLPNGIELEFWS